MKLRRFFAFGAKGAHDILFPVVLQQFGMLVGLHVQGDDFGGESRGKFDALAGDVAPVVDRDDCNGMLAETGCIHWNLCRW